MPVYTYRCENCAHQFDKEQSFSDNPLKTCPNCKKRQLRKVYRPAQVVFKGSGYYVTDNRSRNSAGKANANGSAEKKEEKEGDKTKKRAKDNKGSSKD